MKQTIKIVTILFALQLANAASGQVHGGFSFNYTNLQARHQLDGSSIFWDGIWVDGYDSRLHGGAIGISFFHPIGQGFHFDWGITFGLFHSSNDPQTVVGATIPDEAFTGYTELNINIPLRIAYCFGGFRNFAFGALTGIEMTIPYYSNFSDDREKYEDVSLFKDDDYNRFNLSLDAGVYFNFWGSVRVDLVWSHGLTKFYANSIGDGFRNMFTVSLTLGNTGLF